MVKGKIKSQIIELLVVSLLVILSVISYLFSHSMLQEPEESYDNTNYVSYEILTDNIIPTINENIENNIISRPYNEDNITISNNYYDYKKEDNPENSIIYYENTYIQNTGIDYTRENVFNVISILDGKVVDITEDDITGKTIIIENNKHITSIYESMGDINVTKGDEVKKGQVIGTSGTNEIESELKNHLHFELLIDNSYVNPETYYNMSIGE